MSALALVGVIVFAIAALIIDATYTTCLWLVGHPSHPYQRPHHWRRYVFIVSIIAAEVALITMLAVVLARVVTPPGMTL